MTELTLKLPEKTIKKLRAFAMLSGKKISEVEDDLVSFFDNMLSQACLEKLSDIDGANYSQPTLHVDTEEKKKPSEAEDEGKAFVSEDTSGHELSGDEAEEETKSLAEQYEEEALKKAAAQQEEDDGIKPFDIKVPNAGSNVEAFVDVMEQAAPPTTTHRARVATKSFNPHARRAKVSAYVEDEVEVVEGGDLF